MQEHKKQIKFTPSRCIWLILAVLVVCCLLLSFFETPLGWQMDLTQNKIYTLSQETEDLLEDLEDPVTIYTLYSLGNYNMVMMTLLEKYTISSEKITVSNIDPTTDQPELKKFEAIDEELNDGSLVVVNEETERYRVIDVSELYQEDRDETYFVAENSITSAIHYVVTGEFQRIYFMTGHRETALSQLTGFIRRYQLHNYLIEEYDYLRTAQALVPETDILLCVSPKEDFSETEAASVLEYVKQGGTFVLLYDNAVYDEDFGVIEFYENEMPNLRSMIRDLGIVIKDGIISGENASETGFRNTTIELEETTEGKQIIFSECTALESVPAPGCEVKPILQTRPECVLRDQKTDTVLKKGSFTVGLCSEMDPGRAVVFSTSSFVGDTEFMTEDNADLLDGILRDAMPGEPSVALEAKKANTEELFINSILVKSVIIVAVLLLLPGGILFVGIYVLRKRKEKSN